MHGLPRVPVLAPAGLALAACCLLATAAAAETGRWAPVAGKSHVAFDAKFSLGDFSGTGERLAGAFSLDPEDLRQPVSGSLQIEVAGLATGIGGRDRDLRKVLDAEQFPRMEFTVEGIEPSFPSVTDKGDVLLTIRGRLRIRAVERPLALLARARLRDGAVWVRGDAALKMTDFGITPPTRMFLKVADKVTVRFDLVLTPEK